MLQELAVPGTAARLLALVEREESRLERDLVARLERAPAAANTNFAGNVLTQSAAPKAGEYGYASRAMQKNQNDRETRQQGVVGDNEYSALQNIANSTAIVPQAAVRRDGGLPAGRGRCRWLASASASVLGCHR